MAGQVDRRVPAARDREAIGLDGFDLALVADLDRVQAAAAAGADHFGAGIDRETFGRGRVGPDVDQRGDGQPGGGDVAGGAVGVVVVAEDRDPGAGDDAVAMQVGADRRGGHDAGPVVVAERDQPFMRAAAEERAFRDDPPEAFERRAGGRRAVQVDPAERAVGAAVIGPGDGGARHQADVRQAGEFGCHSRRPVAAGLVGDDLGFAVQPAAEEPVLVGEDHVGSGAAGDQRRHQAGGTAADDQEVAEGVGFLVAVRVREARERAEAGGAADEGLVELLPEGPGPHEGLVVEAGADERGEEVVGGEQVEAERGPAVLAGGREAVVQLLHRRPDVRAALRPAAGGDERVRFLRPGGQRPARAVVLERPPHDPLARRQQRRGDGVAGETVEILAVEAEPDGPGPVDDAAPRDPHRATSAASSAPVI